MSAAADVAEFPHEPKGYQPQGRYRVTHYNKDFGEISESWSDTIEGAVDQARQQLVAAEELQSISVDVFG